MSKYFGFRCPRGKRHSTSLESCASYKRNKKHGCVTCTYPGQVERDLATIEKMVVGYDFHAKGRDKRKRFYFEIDGKLVRLSRRVAAELHKRLGHTLARFPA